MPLRLFVCVYTKVCSTHLPQLKVCYITVLAQHAHNDHVWLHYLMDLVD